MKKDAATIIRKFYNLKRPVTNAEVKAELANVRRKHEQGLLDDFSEKLWAELQIAGHLDKWPKVQAPAPYRRKNSIRRPAGYGPYHVPFYARSEARPVYILQVQKPDGPLMTWTGKSFTNRPEDPPKFFSRADTAKREGKRLLKAFPGILKDYRITVRFKMQRFDIRDEKKERAIRGGSRSPKSNPSPRVEKQIDEATKKLEDFTGHKVTHLDSASSRSNQTTGLIIGELDLIGYRATRDGKTERYGHHFKKHSRPLLAVTSDGKQLHIVGGRYEFTEAGIEDRAK